MRNALLTAVALVGLGLLALIEYVYEHIRPH